MSLRNTFEQRDSKAVSGYNQVFVFLLASEANYTHPVESLFEKKLLKSGRHYLSFVPLHSLNKVKRRER